MIFKKKMLKGPEDKLTGLVVYIYTQTHSQFQKQAQHPSYLKD